MAEFQKFVVSSTLGNLQRLSKYFGTGMDDRASIWGTIATQQADVLVRRTHLSLLLQNLGCQTRTKDVFVTPTLCLLNHPVRLLGDHLYLNGQRCISIYWLYKPQKVDVEQEHLPHLRQEICRDATGHAWKDTAPPDNTPAIPRNKLSGAPKRILWAGPVGFEAPALPKTTLWPKPRC